MRIRTALSVTLRRLAARPALLVVGGVLTLLNALLAGLVAAAMAVAAPGLDRFLVPPLTAGAALVTLPLAVGIYRPLFAAPVGATRTLRDAAAAVARHYRRLLAATLAATAVAALVALGAALLWYVVGTVARFVAYFLGTPHYSAPSEPVVLGVLAFSAGLAVGYLVVGFADLIALDGAADARRAWVASLAFARRRPASLLGYGLANAALGALALGAAGLAGTPLDGAIAGLVLRSGLVTIVGGLATTLAAGFHAVYYERVVRPSLDDATTFGLGLRRRRVAAALLLVVAAVGGAAAVRTADVRPAPDHDPLPADPVAAYRVAVENTATANHREVLYVRNASNRSDSFVAFRRTGVDYRDRQFYTYFGNRSRGGTVVGGYFGEGTLALYNGGGRGSGALVRQTENWTVLSLPGYVHADARASATDAFPDPGADWRVVADNDSTVVLRVTDPDDVRDALGTGSYAGAGERMTADSYLTVRVDREAGVVEGAAFHLHSRATGRNVSYRLRFRDVGTADLARPPAIGPRGVVSRAWDALYY